MSTGIGATCMLALVVRRFVIGALPYLGSIYRYTMYALFTLLFHGHTQFYWIGLLFCCHAAWLWRFRDVASRAMVGGLSALYMYRRRLLWHGQTLRRSQANVARIHACHWHFKCHRLTAVGLICSIGGSKNILDSSWTNRYIA